MRILPSLKQTVMRKILVLSVMMLALCPVMHGREARVAEYPDIYGHYLKREWRRYERLSRRDRPEKEIVLLTFIKEQAQKKPCWRFVWKTRYIRNALNMMHAASAR